jgi:hypothetical protein
MNEPEQFERGTSTVGAVILFCICVVLAFLTLFVLEGVPLWVGVASAAAALFFGWLLMFASSKTRVMFMRWFPWP